MNLNAPAPALKQGATGSAVQRLRKALQKVGAPAITEEPPDQFKGSTACRSGSSGASGSNIMLPRMARPAIKKAAKSRTNARKC